MDETTRELRVNDYYQIRFTLEDGKWLCRWSEEELAFHQKMMNEVIKYERENSDTSTERDISSY